MPVVSNSANGMPLMMLRTRPSVEPGGLSPSTTPKATLPSMENLAMRTVAGAPFFPLDR